MELLQLFWLVLATPSMVVAHVREALGLVVLCFVIVVLSLSQTASAYSYSCGAGNRLFVINVA